MSSLKPAPPPPPLQLIEERETMDDAEQLFSPETDEFLRLERSLLDEGGDEESRKKVLHNELQVSKRLGL